MPHSTQMTMALNAVSRSRATQAPAQLGLIKLTPTSFTLRREWKSRFRSL